MALFDLIIKAGLICDGSGKEPYPGDIGIKDGRIAGLGDYNYNDGEEVVLAPGQVIAPGFIDMHGHSEIALLINPSADSKIQQGITTEVFGNCGMAPAPLLGEYREEVLPDLEKEYQTKITWTTFAEYCRELEHVQPAINAVPLIGQGNIRGAVYGFKAGDADPQQLQEMRNILGQGLKEGGAGVSTGLIYSPGSYTSTEEIINLLKGMDCRFYSSHIRDEGAGLLQSVEEAIAIGRVLGARVEISHLKASGRPNWGKSREALALIDQAVKEGLPVGCDVYPYLASSTGLSAFLPNWAKIGTKAEYLGRLANPEIREKIKAELPDREWTNVVITEVWGNSNRDIPGKSIAQIAEDRSAGEKDTILNLLLEEDGDVGMIHFSMCEEDLIEIIKSPHSCFGSDSTARTPKGLLGQGLPHPRTYGTFPKILAEYVREKGILSLGQAIHKMTGLTAERLGFSDRGKIAPGYWADMVVFDPNDIKDRAGYLNPHQFPQGILCVLVNGRVTVWKGELTGSRAGKILLRGENNG